MRLIVAILFLASLNPAAADGPPSGEPLTLARAVELARTNHPAHLAAQSRVAAAGERVGEARSALWPQISAVAEYLRATDNGVGDTAYLSGAGLPRYPTTGRHQNQLTDTFDNYVGGLSAYQYLFDFGRTTGMIAQRSAEADAEQARLALVDLDLVYGVSKSYFDVLAAQDIVGVYEKAVSQREQHLQEAEVKSRAGLRPEIDAFTARAELARANLHLVDARNALATAKATLQNAMGVGEEATPFRLVDGLAYAKVEQPLPYYLELATAHRPDLAMFEDEARATGAEVTVRRSDYFPSLAAVAGVSARGQGATPGTNLHAGLVVTWPVFNGFLTDHEVTEAKLRQDAIRHDIEDLRQRIALQVTRSYLGWQGSVERIHQADASLAASQVELDLAQKRYDAGLGSIIELTDAQRRFTEDRAQQVEALAAFSIAKAALDRDTADSVPSAGAPHSR